MPREMSRTTFYRAYGKRAIDLAVSTAALVAASPLLAGVAIAVRAKLGSPVIFRQPRAGKDGQPFHIYKFRTMTDERGPDGELLPDEVRLTPFGHFLRKTSLDELPELWNIVRGDMSLVGPRPLLLKYLPLYTKEQARRHDVRPGLTGWVAVNGRNTRSWEERFEQDVWYVDHQDLWLDLRILWRTVAVVVSRENVDPIGMATMPEFKGSTGA
jgi:lipopolysaccharide/colanic/teichoic acid biosynthesis glycosyltransferase